MNKRKRVAWAKHRKVAKKIETKKRAAKAAMPATAAGRATATAS